MLFLFVSKEKVINSPVSPYIVFEFLFLRGNVGVRLRAQAANVVPRLFCSRCLATWGSSFRLFSYFTSRLGLWFCLLCNPLRSTQIVVLFSVICKRRGVGKVGLAFQAFESRSGVRDGKMLIVLVRSGLRLVADPA